VLSPAAGAVVTVAALAAFALVGVRAAARFGVDDPDRYLSARASQGASALALSFFASALGAWILFAPAEVGTFAGLLGIAGYALGQAAAIAIFALVGPAVRARVPSGTTLLEFVRLRFGALPHGYVAAVSVLYMFVFLTAELTAIGGVLALLSGAEPLVAIVAVAAATAAYTAYGGLPASLATDRLQAWLVLAAGVVVVLAVAGDAQEPLTRVRAAEEAASLLVGAETFAVLVIAIVAANLFHQGFWQRTWAARDERTLARGALGGALLIVPVVLLAGLAGMLAAGGDAVEVPSLALFGLLGGLGAPLLALVVVLALGLVASSVDTLQNALTGLVSTGSGGRLGLRGARLLTVALTVPAAAIALEGVSVLRLFLVADLLAATIAFPVFLGLARWITAPAALAGAGAGLLGVVLFGWADTGSAVEGLRLLTLPEGPSLGAFLAAPAASASVTVAVSLASSQRRRQG
jgi:solute:Na+ symporter, SSS family